MSSNDKDAEAQRAFQHGAGASAADAAVEGRVHLEDRFEDAPATRPAPPLADGEIPDQLADKARASGSHEEALIDEAVEESFPASDPPSPHRST